MAEREVKAWARMWFLNDEQEDGCDGVEFTITYNDGKDEGGRADG